MFKVQTSDEFLIPCGQPRFRSGKLIMLSPKHKPTLNKSGGIRHLPAIYAVVDYVPPNESTTSYLQTVSQPYIPWLGGLARQNFVLKPEGHLAFGEPILLLEDPWLVNLEKINKAMEPLRSLPWSPTKPKAPELAHLPPVKETHRNYSLEAIKSAWIMPALHGDKLMIVTVTPKAWLHYLATVVPLRIKKYGIGDK